MAAHRGVVTDRFVRGVGSKKGQGDQDGVDVPRRVDVGRKNKPGYIF